MTQAIVDQLYQKMLAEDIRMSGSHCVLSVDELAEDLKDLEVNGKLAHKQYGLDTVLHNVCLQNPDVIEPGRKPKMDGGS